MKQEYFCDGCRLAGSVEIEEHASVFGVFNRIHGDHAAKSPACFSAREIRVRNPEICTEAEWARIIAPKAKPMSDEVPEGYRYEWVADDSWCLLSEPENRRCRMKGCKNQAVAALRRKHGKGVQWWAYCGLHLYGRKIEDGVVKCRRLVPIMEGLRADS